MNLKSEDVLVDTIRIAIVDDDPSVASAIRRMVESNTDYETMIAYNGRDALKLVRNELPDLVLLDIVMPGMSGLEVLQRLKSDSWTLHVPVVVFTGYDDEENRDESGFWYADAFLPKSCGREKLLATIDNILSLRGNHRRL